MGHHISVFNLLIQPPDGGITSLQLKLKKEIWGKKSDFCHPTPMIPEFETHLYICSFQTASKQEAEMLAKAWTKSVKRWDKSHKSFPSIHLGHRRVVLLFKVTESLEKEKYAGFLIVVITHWPHLIRVFHLQYTRGFLQMNASQGQIFEEASPGLSICIRVS